MPANLPPEVIELLEKAKLAKSPEERIKIYMKVISLTPKHKGTEKFLKEIKRKISEIRKEIEKRKSVKKGKKLGIKKMGITIGILGVENTCKSLFLNRFAGTKLRSTEVPFETTEPKVGVIKYKDVDLYFLEIPSFYEGISEKGEISNAVRICDFFLIFLDPKRDLEFQRNLIRKELERMKVWLGRRPNVKIERKERGGIEIEGIENFDGSREEILEVMKSKKIYNAYVYIGERIDAEMFERILDKGFLFRDFLEVRIDEVFRDFGKVIEEIWKRLGIKRIYTKSRGKIAGKPIVFTGDVSIRDVCERIHEEFLERFRYAKVWGSSVKFPGQRVGLDHKLEDGDIVEIFLR